MTENYRTCLVDLLNIAVHCINGTLASMEAESSRCSMDDAWITLTDAEQDAISKLSKQINEAKQ